jgi:hypothetical protein
MQLTIAGQEFTVLAGSLKPVEEGVEGVVQRLENLGFGVTFGVTDRKVVSAGVSAGQPIVGLDRFQRLHGLPVQQVPDAAFRKKLQGFHGS